MKNLNRDHFLAAMTLVILGLFGTYKFTEDPVWKLRLAMALLAVASLAIGTGLVLWFQERRRAKQLDADFSTLTREILKKRQWRDKAK